MINIERLEILAKEFRDALEIVVKKRLYGRLTCFSNFPKECCRYTCDLLAEYFLSKEIPMECIQVFDAESNVEHYTHCWIVVDNVIIVDITADQFNNKSYFKKYEPIPDVYVRGYDVQYLHSCFCNSTTQRVCNMGINSYNGDIPTKLKIVYEAVIEQIESLHKGD